MKKKVLFLFLSQLLTCLPARQAFNSQTLSKDYLGDLGTYIITSKKEIWQIAKGVEVITEKEIEESGAENIIEILKDNSTLLSFDWLGNSAKATVDSTGFGESSPSNILVLVDGRRLNEIDLSGVDWLQIPVERIKRIEIIKGGYSSLYGDNATGAVINIITEKCQDKKIDFGFSSGSFDTRRFKLISGNRTNKISYLLTASNLISDGYRENNWIKRNDFTFDFNYDSNFKLNFNFSFNKNKYGLPGGLWEDEYITSRRNSKNLDDKGESETLSFALEGEKRIGDLKLNTFIFHRRKELISTFPDYNSIYDYEYPNSEFRQEISFNTFLAGFHFFDANSDSVTKDYKTLKEKSSQNLEKKSFGAFFEKRFFISKEVIFNLSARTEKVNYTLKSSTPGGVSYSDKKEERINSLNSGISFRPNENTNLYLSFGKSFRLPNVDEFKIWDWTSGIPKGINKDLKSQRSYELDFGIRKSFSRMVKVSFNFYNMKVKDEIFYNPLSGSNENLPLTLHQGFDVVLKFTPVSWMGLNLSYSYIRAILKEKHSFTCFDWNTFSSVNITYKEGNKIPGVPNNKITTSLFI
ncbi:MAG: hypothetical protein DRI36_05640, partial [Caldiserica bacterium]